MRRSMGIALGALFATVALLAACGGGGGGDGSSGNGTGSTSTSAPAPAPTPAPVPAPAPSPAPSSTPSDDHPLLSGAAIVGATVVNLVHPYPKYAGAYVSRYQALSNNVYAMTYNAAANEVVVAGNVLAGGAPGVQGLDPATLAVKWSLPTPSAGDTVAVSDDGSKAFVGLCTQQSVAQLDLVTHNIDVVFAVGQQVCAGDIAVRPGHPATIAVTQIVQGTLAPRSFGTAMFTNGVPLASAVNDLNSSGYVVGSWGYTSSVVVRFLGPDALVGYSDYTTNTQLQRYAVSDSGLSLTGLQEVGAWDETLTVKDGLLYFGYGVAGAAADMSNLRMFSHCQSTFPGYNVGVPDLSRPEFICVRSVPSEERLASQTVELELASWTLDGGRVTRRTRLNLRDVITIPGLATSEVELERSLVTPSGQIVLHIYDYQSNHLLLVSVSPDQFAPVAAPTVAQGHVEASGTVLDWVDVPATATAFDPASNRLYGIVPGSYGPNGSSVVALDGASKQVLGFALLRGEPRALALSSDGRYAYAQLDSGVQQVDLSTLSGAWFWPAGECPISAIAPRPGYPQQVFVSAGTEMHLVDSGHDVSTLPRPATSGCGYTGAALFTDSNRLVVMQPEFGTLSVYDLSAGSLAPVAAPAGAVAGGGTGYFQATRVGYVYNDGGDIADTQALRMTPVAPASLSYTLDSSANYEAQFQNLALGGSCGCGPLTAFTPLTSSRFLAVRQQLRGVAMFDLYNGTTHGGRLVVTDPVIGSSHLEPTVLDSSNIAFGQASGALGQGAVYWLRLPF